MILQVLFKKAFSDPHITPKRISSDQDRLLGQSTPPTLHGVILDKTSRVHFRDIELTMNCIARIHSSSVFRTIPTRFSLIGSVLVYKLAQHWRWCMIYILLQVLNSDASTSFFLGTSEWQCRNDFNQYICICERILLDFLFALLHGNRCCQK